MQEIDSYIMGFLKMAVQNLSVQFGDPHGGWRLQYAAPLEERTTNNQFPIYRIQIVVNDHFCYEGIAIFFSEHVIEIMLNSQAVYSLLRQYIDVQLQKYTVDHPWIVGV